METTPNKKTTYPHPNHNQHSMLPSLINISSIQAELSGFETERAHNVYTDNSYRPPLSPSKSSVNLRTFKKNDDLFHKSNSNLCFF